jgi:HEAT repeat protein
LAEAVDFEFDTFDNSRVSSHDNPIGLAAGPHGSILSMLRSRANEIPELVQRLGSRKRTCVDAARARLSIIGPRAVEELVEALEGDNHRIRARVMPLLALIQDSRGRGPLIAMLLDRSSRLREIAARCLGRFPATETVAALNRTLVKDRGEKVKIAAVQSLVEQYAAGQDRAICKVLEIITDTGAATGIRIAALSLLPKLRPSARRGILERLQEDPQQEIRVAAAKVEDGAAAGSERPAGIGAAVNALASNDYATWNEAVGQLAACGAAAIDPLLSEMHGRAHDPEFCKRAGVALKAMGPRRAKAIADTLDRIEEPLPLQVLVEVIGALGEKSQIYRLKDLIDRLAERPVHLADVNGWDPMQRVRARAHLALAQIGSRVAIRDLRDALGDPERRVELEMLSAVELIGKKDEIAVLLRAYGREDDFMKQRIADAVRTIRKRERIRRNNRMFQTLSRDQLRALAEILPPPAPRKAPRRAPRAARPRPRSSSA